MSNEAGLFHSMTNTKQYLTHFILPQLLFGFLLDEHVMLIAIHKMLCITPPLNLLQQESRKPPSTRFSEKALITNVTQGKLSNKKFSMPKIHKKHLKLVTQL